VCSVYGSSHSEAPGTARQPQADDTDFYAFVSYETGRSNFVTFVKNVDGRQGPGAGPNYYSMSDEHFYEIYIDVNGDAIEDQTFQWIFGFTFGGTTQGNVSFQSDTYDCVSSGEVFRFTNIGIEITNAGKAVPIALKVAGVIDVGAIAALNQVDNYNVNLIFGGRDSTNSSAIKNAATGSTQFTRPMDYAGEKSFPHYTNYANQFLYNITIPFCSTNGRMFVGQRRESFSINLGGIFDIFNFIPIPTFPGAIAETKANNYLQNNNVASFIIEVPIACLYIPSSSKGVIGAWAGIRELLHDASGNHIAGLQVSRLGNPLVNELVIGLKDKWVFNNAQPKDDSQFLTYVQYATFPSILSSLFTTTVNNQLGTSFTQIAPTNFPRADLVAVFLTGLNTVNSLGVAEYLRLNTSIPPTTFANQKRYGLLAADLAGFPNGRRPGDDIVDIAVQVMMGAICYTSFNICPKSAAVVGNVAFTDGSPQYASDFQQVFPYLQPPVPGYFDGEAVTSPAAALQPVLMRILLSFW